MKRSRNWSWARLRGHHTPPGTIAESEPTYPSRQEALSYGPERVADHQDTDLPVCWVTISGSGDGRRLRALRELVPISDLWIEDIQHSGQRPRIERDGDTLFAVLQWPSWIESEGSGNLQTDQLALIASGGTVVLVREHDRDPFSELRSRIHAARGRVRARGADYLVYALIDALVDDLALATEHLQELVEDAEEAIIARPERAHITRIHDLRGAASSLRRSVAPLRDSLGMLAREAAPQRDDSAHLLVDRPDLLPFIADLRDHVLAVMEAIEVQADRIKALFHLHASMVSTSTNEVMRTLTIIATVFIPLTFIAGIYGMNFETMPELAWRWGYPVVLAFMGTVAGGMLVYFRVKRWL